MYESSGSQFFRTAPIIQSGPGGLEESRLFIKFLMSLRASEMLCSFRLVLHGDTGIGIAESLR